MPPDEQDRVIGWAFDETMRKHGLTMPTPEMIEHGARVYALIAELEQRVGHA
jgi:hypothetical protein